MSKIRKTWLACLPDFMQDLTGSSCQEIHRMLTLIFVTLNLRRQKVAPLVCRRELVSYRILLDSGTWNFSSSRIWASKFIGFNDCCTSASQFQSLVSSYSIGNSRLCLSPSWWNGVLSTSLFYLDLWHIVPRDCASIESGMPKNRRKIRRLEILSAA